MGTDNVTDGPPAASSAPPSNPFHGQLHKIEYYWRDRQRWLEQCGYMLRPRYRPDWKPSWEGTDRPYYECEDGKPIRHPYILDATRLSDGSVVTLKKISKSVHPHEVEIGQFLSSALLRSDPQNHCVPIHEALQDPTEEDSLIIVMSFLKSYNDPRFGTVGEAIDFFHQAFEGLLFMHHHHVAHRDISSLNILMDPVPLYPQMYHPYDDTRTRDFSDTVKHYTRTERPTKYYFVDFGLSRRYNPEEGPPLELPILGGDKTVPEFQNNGYNEPSDPFPTDIYYLGNLIREDFLQKYFGLEFMDAIVADMVQEDPKARPTITEILARFEEIKKSISTWKCRARLVSRKEGVAIRTFKGLRHIFRTVVYIAKRLPSIPTYTMPPPT